MGENSVTVFYTDDDGDDQSLFQRITKEYDENIRLRFQNDGQELLDELNNSNSLPDIIFLDLNMPRKNGIEALKEIRVSEEYQKIPIVIFSTSDNMELIAKSRQLGANFYIIKPFSIALLRKAIFYTLSVNWNAFKPDESGYVYDERKT